MKFALPPLASPDAALIDAPLPPPPKADKGALRALFAGVSRNRDNPVIPLSESAFAPGSTLPAFYCIHSVSGSAGLDFAELARHLSPSARVHGIQAPRARMRDPAFGTSVASMAGFYADALIEFQPDGVFLLGGWSAGVIIALEVAQQLRARGRTVGLLVAIDWAPENTGAGLPVWHPRYLLELMGNVRNWFVRDDVRRKGIVRAAVRRAADKLTAFTRAGWAILRGRSGRGHQLAGYMDLTVYQAMQTAFIERLYTALFQYRAASYPGDVLVYEATTRPLHRLPQIARIWHALAPRTIVVPVAARHATIVHDPSVATLAQDLQQRLARFAVQS